MMQTYIVNVEPIDSIYPVLRIPYATESIAHEVAKEYAVYTDVASAVVTNGITGEILAEYTTQLGKIVRL